MILRNGHIECFKVITNAGVLPPIGGKDSNSWPFGMWVLKLRLIVGCWGCFRAAAGLSGLLRGCRKAGPAGLRGLLKSPPHLAGQASAPLRGSLVNPCRDSWPFIVWDCRGSPWAAFTWAAKALPGGVALRAENWVYLWTLPV
jgi:hypothetical protein